MDKNIKTFIVLAIVLLYPLIFSSYAQAGFYDWLVSREPIDSNLVSPMAVDTGASFEKIFSWDARRPESSEIDNLIMEEPEPEIKVISTHIVRATGYSSTPDQTDSTPFITASGTSVRDGIIAANVYANGRRIPFGTLVRIPEIYGDKIFIVEDRMNIRYKNNIDIWFPERSLAREFGSKRVTIEIIDES